MDLRINQLERGEAMRFAIARGRARSAGKRLARTAATAGIFAIGAAIAGCGGGAPTIGTQPVKRVYAVENNVDALRVWSDTRARADVLVHIDSADDLGVFPQSLMDSVEGVARRLQRGDVTALGTLSSVIERGSVATVGYMAGMYKRVVWVIPAANPTAEEPPETYRTFFIERRKFPPAAVGEFKAEGKIVTGSIAGIPLAIARLEDLSLGPKETAVVDIDLNYFQLLAAQDPNYRTGTRSLLAFLRKLAAAGVRARLVTVNCATQGNDVPMDLRYYAEVIAGTLAIPKSLEPPPSGKYETMIQAEDSMRAGRYGAAAALYRSILEAGGKSAGMQFALAVALGFHEKGIESRAALLEAYYLDHEYLRGFSQLARVLGAAGKIATGLEILEAPELENLLGDAELAYQKGVFFYTSKRPFDAATYLWRSASSRSKDFGLYTILFRAHREMGDSAGEVSALQRLVDIDEGRVRREMPWVFADLGQLYERAGFPGNAGEMYEKYIEVAPTDSLSAIFRKKLDAWGRTERPAGTR
jgi:tetratricopeptide (TPR) repeat protein